MSICGLLWVNHKIQNKVIHSKTPQDIHKYWQTRNCQRQFCLKRGWQFGRAWTDCSKSRMLFHGAGKIVRVSKSERFVWFCLLFLFAIKSWLCRNGHWLKNWLWVVVKIAFVVQLSYNNLYIILNWHFSVCINIWL